MQVGIKRTKVYKRRIYSLLIATTIAMGLLGTSYAYWTDGLQIKATVSTGKIDIQDTVTILKDNGKGFNLSNGNENGNGGQTIEKGFKIENKSSIPIEFKGIKSIKVRPIDCVSEGYIHSHEDGSGQCMGVDVTEKLMKGQQSYITIEWNSDFESKLITGDIKIDKHDGNEIIKKAMMDADGAYKFEKATVDVELEFSQINNSNGWSDTTTLSIGVTCSRKNDKDLELLVPTPLPMPLPEEVPGPEGPTGPGERPELKPTPLPLPKPDQPIGPGEIPVGPGTRPTPKPEEVPGPGAAVEPEQRPEPMPLPVEPEVESEAIPETVAPDTEETDSSFQDIVEEVATPEQ